MSCMAVGDTEDHLIQCIIASSAVKFSAEQRRTVQNSAELSCNLQKCKEFTYCLQMYCAMSHCMDSAFN